MRVPAAIAALPLLAGSAAGALIADVTPERFVVAASACAALALIAAFGFFADHAGWAATLSVALGFALAGLSMSAAYARELYGPSLLAWFDRHYPSQPDGADVTPVRIEGILREDAALAPFGASVGLEVRTVTSAGGSESVRGGVRLTIGGSVPASAVLQWRAGRRVRLPVLLRRPATFHNPGVPDETRALARRGVALLGSVKSASLVEVISAGSRMQERASAARAWVRRTIGRHVGPFDRTSAAVALSILIGDRTGLSEDVEQRLQDAGTYHVIAISGGNIAILTAILMFVTRVIQLPPRASASTAIVILLFYGDLAGGSPSVSRAVAAAVVLLFARAIDHRGSPLNVVAIAAILGAAAMPVTVFDAGFLLSFAATAGIVLGLPRITSGFSRKIGRGIVALFAATVCAEIAIAPIAASCFARITAAGLVVNFAAIPLMTLVQVASLALLALSPFTETGAAAAARLVHLSATGLLESARFIELAPWLARDVPAPAWWFCGFYYLTAATVLARPTRTRIGLLAAVVACLTVGLPAASRGLVAAPATGRLRIVVLDAGQGDATIVIPPRGEPVLVDAGGVAGTSFDLGTRVLTPALRALGIARLHAFVLTHADPDHIGGADVILQRFRPRNVWDGVPVPPHPARRALYARADAQRIVWRTVRPGDTERTGEVELRVLHPPAPDWERQRVRNDDSVVLEVRYGDVSVLLPGDIGREVEESLVPTLQLAPLVILKAAHHGSATSSSEAFLDAITPAAVVFSAGKNNRFGHPAKVVVERFRVRGVEMFNTAHDGAVFVETDGKSVEVRGWGSKRTMSKTTAGARHDVTTPRRHDIR